MKSNLKSLVMAVALSVAPMIAVAGDVNTGVSHSHTTGWSNTSYDSNQYTSFDGNGVSRIRSSTTPGDYNVRREVYEVKGASNDHTVGEEHATFTQDSRSISAMNITTRTSTGTNSSVGHSQSHGGAWEETEGTYREHARVDGNHQHESGSFEAWNDSGYNTSAGTTTSGSSSNQTVTTNYNR